MTPSLARSRTAELVYTVEGSGKDVVLLLMGLGGRASDWGTIFPSALAARHRVVRYDHRGVGKSPRADGAYTLNDMATDATAVLDAVGVERAHVVGYSMGGMISQLIATEHADRVEQLVLMSTHFGGDEVVPPTADAMRLFDPQEFLALGRNAEAMMRFTIGVLTPPGFLAHSPESLAMMIANARSEPTRPATFMAQAQAIIASDRSKIVSGIRKPTLVIHGTHDPLIPTENGRMIAQRIAGARFELLENTGHMPMLECPEKIAELVLGFLDR